MALVIDAGVFITLERRGFAPDDIQPVARAEPPAIAAITASELLFGVHRADNEARRMRRTSCVEGIFARVDLLTFSLDVARIHARVWAHLAAIGTPIGQNDLVVAATALLHGFPVLTENVREFDRVPDLVVIRPTWPP